MASDVHSDNRSRVVGSPRFHPGFASRCYGEPYAPGRRTKLRSGSATRHSLVSRQTLRALVSAPTDGLPFCAHSGCPKPSRLSPRETLAVRWSGEIPRLPRRSCGGPPVPPHARGEGRTPPAAARCLCAYSGRGVGPLPIPHCVRLGESRPHFVPAAHGPVLRRIAVQARAHDLVFFYLEIGIPTLAPGWTGSVTQPGSAPAPADSRTSQGFQLRSLPQIFLQLGQGPSGESQPQILRMGGGHLQHPGGGFGVVIGRASRAGALRQPLDSRRQEPSYPAMSVGIVETDRLAGLHQRTAGRQLPDQGRPSVHSSGCGARTQQALQIHQLFARQFGKSNDAAHADSVASSTPEVKSIIVILMNKPTRLRFAFVTTCRFARLPCRS